MPGIARFKVDPKLPALLGSSYRSAELALKELVDNAWDAEAAEVSITLPDPLSQEPVVVSDNGCGMTPNELKGDFLNIASSRTSRKGARTPHLHRLVKGRKGVGKFSGLELSDEMRVSTTAHGNQSSLSISRKALLEPTGDLAEVDLPFQTSVAPGGDSGTTITLVRMSDKRGIPTAEAMRELLAYDYGTADGFVILVNGQRIVRADVKGEKFKATLPLRNNTVAELHYTVTEKPRPAKHAGIMLRSGEKSVGKPHFFGLENEETLSDALRRRIIGELRVDSDAIELNAAGSDVVETDSQYRELEKWVATQLTLSLKECHTKEFNLAKARWQKQVNDALEKLPESRREVIGKRIENALNRVYQEEKNQERIGVMVELMLSAIEHDEYWEVCKHLNEADKVDVATLAGILEQFGLCDLALMARQAESRMKLLDQLEQMARNPKTTELQIHKALEKNMWVFGAKYALMASNISLKRIVEEQCAKAMEDDNSNTRPDLLLSADPAERHLLIEFKKPDLPLKRRHESQAKEYADTLTKHLGHKFEILVIGGHIDDGMDECYDGKATRFATYDRVFSDARRELTWLLNNLGRRS